MKPYTDSAQRQAAFSRLYNLGQSFGAVFDLQELIRRIVDAALSLSDADEAVLAIIDPDPTLRNLGLRAVRSGSPTHDYTPLANGDHPLVAAVQKRNTPVELPADLAALTAANAHSLSDLSDRPAIFVPMRRNEGILAVLGVLRPPGADPFPEHVQELLTGLSSYGAIAIENARLYKQALDRTMELSLLVESSNAVSSSLDLSSVLNAIARYMMRALDAHWSIISVWDPETHELRRLAEHRQAVWPMEKGPLLNLREEACYRMLVESEQPFPVHYTRSTAEEPVRRCMIKHNQRRVLIVPLQVKGHIVGFVELVSLHHEEPFLPSQIGHGMRLALELAPLLQGSAMPSRGDLFSAARMLTSTTGTNFASVYSWEPGSDTARRIVSYGVGLWAEQAGPQSVVMDQPTLAVVVREQRIGLMRSTDPNLNPEEAALFDDVGPSAQLVLPLVFKGRTVGLVQLFDINPEREFVSRETALAHTLANQAAIALENAHLVRDLQRSLDEQKAMQSRLVHAARLSALGELSTVVAHQINNPLTTVLGDAEMLVQDIPPDNPAHESAKAILRAGTRAKQVVERLLTMAHMENEMRVQDVNRTIEETLQLIGTSITQQHIALDVHLADNLPLVLAIPGQLEDVWMNLIINARDGITQRGNDGGHIRIASRSVEDGKLVEVTITDNGAGMTAEQVRQAFDPFFTTKPRGKGTGLGLYICRQIVDEHDGNIQIESTPGEGTTVVVTLPTAAEGDRST